MEEMKEENSKLTGEMKELSSKINLIREATEKLKTANATLQKTIVHNIRQIL